MKLNLLHILCAILLCWGGLGLDNIFLKVMHYRNSVLYTALLLSEFHSKRYANFLSFDENLRNLHIG